MKHKQAEYWLSLIFLLVLGGVFLLSAKKLWRSEDPAALPDGSVPFTVTAYSDAGEQTLELWQEDARIWHLFLPAWAQPGRLELIPGDADTLELGGEVIDRPCFYPLEPGQMSFRWKGRSDECTLIVHQPPADVATFHIETEGGVVDLLCDDKFASAPGRLEVLDAHGGTLYAGRLRDVRTRGNSSWYDCAKKSFQITTEDPVGLFGMGQARKWVLLANATDRTYMRNQLAYQLALEAGVRNALESRPVELYVDGQYQGLYLLCEKVEIGPDRIPIHDLEAENERLNPELDFEALEQQITGTFDAPGSAYWFSLPAEPEDATGGYLLELDLTQRRGDEKSSFVTDGGQDVVIKSPKYVTCGQADHIRAAWQRLENAVCAPDGIDPVSGAHWTELADLASFADKFIMEEFTQNIDAVGSSQYFYKDRDSVDPKFYAGPPWDYDLSLGSRWRFVNMYHSDKQNPERLMLVEEEGFWPTLYGHEDFRQAVAAAYGERFVPVLERQIGQMDALTAWVQPHAMIDAARWSPMSPAQAEEDFAEQAAILKDYVVRRTAWLENTWCSGENNA